MPGQLHAPLNNRPTAKTADKGESTLLTSHAIAVPATFAFSCYGIPFEVAVVRDAHSVAKLVVRGDLGAMPFSAESPVARRYMRAVVDAGADLPYATITLSKKQFVMVHGSMEFPKRPSPATVAAGTAAIVIAAKPIIELIAACRAISRSPA